MYAKLTWRNLRRSLADYGIYFMTLVFAVAIFYVSNSVTEQPAFLSLSESQRRMARSAVEGMEWVSTIMTGVVALLVLYANRVIVRKRSRELGTYLLLGMDQGHLAALLLAETSAIGLAALGVGMVTGVLTSQAFGLLVERAFHVMAPQRDFVFSARAALATLVLYGVVFLAVAIWQAASIYRQRLIELIHEARKNEEIRVRSRPLAALAGLLSAMTLVTAYGLADWVSRSDWLDPTDPRIPLGVALGIAGTYLLFAALAGLLTGVRRRAGGWLARGLNLFLYRQVTSKINTHAAMLATIALMLTFTVCAMSTGLSLGAIVRRDAEERAPFSYMVTASDPEQDLSGLWALFAAHGVADAQMVEFVTVDAGLRGADLMLPDDAERFMADEEFDWAAWASVSVMPYSAYRSLRAFKGYPEVPFAEGGYLVHAADSDPAVAAGAAAWTRALIAGQPLELAGVTLRPAAPQVFSESMGYQFGGYGAMLVVPDEVVARLLADLADRSQRYLVAEVPGEEPDRLAEAVGNWVSARIREEGWISLSSRTETMAETYVVEAVFIFFSFYVGIMFILISATLLALQQVTDAVEHRQRYAILQNLGADDAMMDLTIARQVGLYFLTPLLVALLHSAMALTALNRALSGETGYQVVGPASLPTLGVFALIYGAYYLLSVQNCRLLYRPRTVD